jgi:hypothetical protein
MILCWLGWHRWERYVVFNKLAIIELEHCAELLIKHRCKRCGKVRA